jgi:RNA polymerase sigma-70 factor (ECF subfamily)
VIAEPAERRTLNAARGGDERAFVQLTGSHRAPLHRHCYRLLGSLHDADDAVQETMLRAWKGIGSFEPRAPLAAWLYRIATNVCLRAIEQRGRVRAGEHLDPYPDVLLETVVAPGHGPEAEVAEREWIGLAFVAAVQLLPARQRVALVLRDVLDLPARDVAELTGDSIAAVNSAAQRARATLAHERAAPTVARRHAPESAAAEELLMRRFQDAWAAADVDGLVALLADDCLLTMPPEPSRFDGRDAVGAFFATVPMGGRLDLLPLTATRANGQPALAAYADEAGDGVQHAYGVMVFAVDGDHIGGITGFAQRPELFERLGLPTRLPPL